MSYLVALGAVLLFGFLLLVVGNVVRPQSKRVMDTLGRVQRRRSMSKRRWPSQKDVSWSGPGWECQVTYEERSCSIEGPGLPEARLAYTLGGRWPTARVLREGFHVSIAERDLVLRRPTYGLRRRRRAVLVSGADGNAWEIRAWDALAVAVLRADSTVLAIFPFGSSYWLIRTDASPSEISLSVALNEMWLYPRVHLLGRVAAAFGFGH